jgi:hypothetical protein
LLPSRGFVYLLVKDWWSAANPVGLAHIATGYECTHGIDFLAEASRRLEGGG